MTTGLRVSPSQLRITNEYDPETRRPIGIRLLVSWQEPQQVIYTDGRPHPSPNAPHKWSGYSTGRWDRNALVYTTTHLKEAYLSRNGVPKSIKSTVTTRIHRYGSLLSVWFFINDPAYLTTPYIRASSFVLDPNQIIPPFPCEISPDGTIVPAGKVPNFLPGKNEVLPEFATDTGFHSRRRSAASGNDVPRVHQEDEDHEGGATHDDRPLSARAVRAFDHLSIALLTRP